MAKNTVKATAGTAGKKLAKGAAKAGAKATGKALPKPAAKSAKPNAAKVAPSPIKKGLKAGAKPVPAKAPTQVPLKESTRQNLSKGKAPVADKATRGGKAKSGTDALAGRTSAPKSLPSKIVPSKVASGPAKMVSAAKKAPLGASGARKAAADVDDEPLGLLEDEFGDENSETLGLDLPDEADDGIEDHERHGPPVVHAEADDGGPDAEETPPDPAALVQKQVTSSGSGRRKTKDSFQFDRDGDLLGQWQVFFEKNKGIRPLTYKMTESFPARVPLQHKVLGWGFVISNLNDRLEVLFKDGLRVLISNYKG